MNWKQRNGRNALLLAKFIWEPRDMWVGLYWKRYPCAIDLYFCMIPCVPFYVYYQWGM